MAYTKYSLTPANNTAAPPDGAPEGMLPSAVNDTMRDMMAQIRDVGDGVRDGTYTMTAPKITGGTITGVAITSSTGSFTTLSTSSTTTFSGLTASTALALDASKNVVSVTNTGTGNNVLSASPTLTGTIAGASLSLSSLTSGRVTYAGASGLLSDSATLTYDGTSLTTPRLVLGGTTLPSAGTATLFSRTSDNNTYLQTGSGNNFNLLDGSQNTMATFSPTALNFNISNTERMRLTSTGLGIGTSSPAFKTEIVGGATTVETTLFQIRSDAGGIGTGSTIAFANSTSTTAGSGRVELAAIRTTSSGGSFVIRTGDDSGTIQERMRITSAGNVGIGTSSPDSFTTFPSKLVVGSGTGNQQITIYSGTTSEGNLIFADGTSGSQQYMGLLRYDHADNAMKFYTNGGTLGMTQDASGNLGLGVTPSAWQTTSGSRAIQFTGSAVYGYRDTNLILTQNAYFDGAFKYYASSIASAYYGIGSGVHSWYTAPSGTAGNAISFTQAMTLDSSGNLFVGTTALSQAKVGILFDGSISQGFVIRTSLPSSGSEFIRFENSSGTTQGYITALTTTTTSYVGTSDQRLKKNIVDAPSFLSVINSLKVRQFDWKENGETDIGFIAQELHTKLPKTVAVGIDNEDGSIKLPWGVDKSAIIPYLVKAIQEQQALIESLTTRLTALENK